MLRREVVDNRKWIDDSTFSLFLGLTNIIPGPNSTEIVLLTGKRRAGVRGLLAAGAGFITPAVLITLSFAALYVRYGTTAGVEWPLYGVKPVIVVIVAHALVILAKGQLRKPLAALIAISAAIGYLAGIGELLLLVAGALVLVAAHFISKRIEGLGRASFSFAALKLSVVGLAATTTETVPYSATRLFLSFLKIGAVLYGSGYVLIAFLRSEFVVKLGWITEQQLLDAVAFGQITPGPVFSTATFVGYLVGGVPGAIVATVAIFLPAFLFVFASEYVLGLIHRYSWIQLALAGVTFASIGLIAGVLVQLGQDALVDLWTVSIAGVAAILIFRLNVGSTRLLLLGAAAGVLSHVLR